MANLMIHVPIQTRSEPNQRDHWAVRNERKKEQQKAVYYAWKQAAFGREVPGLPCVVHLTRFGPRLMDSDNLAASFKGIRDTVAELLKVDDGDERIRFEYNQQLDSDYAITIQVEGKL